MGGVSCAMLKVRVCGVVCEASVRSLLEAAGMRGLLGRPLWIGSEKSCGCGMACRNEDHYGHFVSVSTVRGERGAGGAGAGGGGVE